MNFNNKYLVGLAIQV